MFLSHLRIVTGLVVCGRWRARDPTLLGGGSLRRVAEELVSQRSVRTPHYSRSNAQLETRLHNIPLLIPPLLLGIGRAALPGRLCQAGRGGGAGSRALWGRVVG